MESATQQEWIVKWGTGDVIGVYTAADEDGALLACIQDAGCATLDDAEDVDPNVGHLVTVEADIADTVLAYEEMGGLRCGTCPGEHVALSRACAELAVRQVNGDDTMPNSRRFVFADDSVITMMATGWGRGYTNCWCWENYGHEDCPVS